MLDTGDRLVELGVGVGRCGRSCLHDTAAALWTFDVEQHARSLSKNKAAEGLAARHPKENPATGEQRGSRPLRFKVR